MAKARWIASCGHWDSRVLTNRRNAQFAEENGKLKPCSECAKKIWLEEQRAKEAVALETIKATETLPELQGSEKQVAWATTIRAQMLLSMKKFVEEVAAQIMEDAENKGDDFLNIPKMREQFEIIKQSFAEYKAETSAKEWIELRVLSPEAALRYKALEISKRA